VRQLTAAGRAFNTAWPRAKPRYLSADPRVSLTVVDPEEVPGRVQPPLGARLVPARPRPEELRVGVRITPKLIESRGIDD
jgi:hypothetical protein